LQTDWENYSEAQRNEAWAKARQLKEKYVSLQQRIEQAQAW
jgi:hypothetical protein